MLFKNNIKRGIEAQIKNIESLRDSDALGRHFFRVLRAEQRIDRVKKEMIQKGDFYTLLKCLFGLNELKTDIDAAIEDTLRNHQWHKENTPAYEGRLEDAERLRARASEDFDVADLLTSSLVFVVDEYHLFRHTDNGVRAFNRFLNDLDAGMKRRIAPYRKKDQNKD